MGKKGRVLGTETIPNPFLKRVHLTPERIAVKFQDKEYTFQEIYDKSLVIAGMLCAQGVQKDQVVAVLLKNHFDTVVIFLSLQLLGAKALIINNRLTTEEILWQIKDSQSSLFITENSFQEKVQQIEPQLDGQCFMIKKEELVTMPYKDPLIQEEVSLNDVCSIMYTSGTTGKPKGVLQTYGNHWWSAAGSALNLGLHQNDCWLCAVPLFHISGYSILMRGIFYGMKVVLHESFHEERIISSIRKDKVTIMSVVATMLSRMIDRLGDESLPDYFRCMLLGGGPAPLSLLEKCAEKMIPVYQTYGMTETSSQIVTLSPEYSLTKLGSAGKPLFPSQLKIVNQDGEKAKPFESGEIAVKGPNVTIGYLNREKLESDWFFTGDIGYLDDEGFLFVQDRRSDLIISGGENIYPAEVEGVITSHPNVADAGVVGMNDDTWGQVPVAFIVKKGPIDEEQLRNYCLERMAKYKVPKQFRFVQEIPRNASKKILRRTLREWLQ